MDRVSIIIVISIILIAYYLNINRSKNTLVTHEITFAPKEKIVDDIYNSNMIESVNDEGLKRALGNYEKSKNPSETNILPPIFNNGSGPVGLDPGDKIIKEDLSWADLAKISYINKTKNINESENVTPLIDRPMFQSLLPNLENNSIIETFTTETNQNDISLLTGKPLEKTSTNMVPFFKGSLKQNISEHANVAKLDHFTGNTSTFFHKKEPLQRFKETPVYNIDKGTKTPDFIDNVDITRYIPSRFKTDEKPFETIKVAAPIAFTVNNPIINAQTSFKTIDELRTANKPQISYEGKTIDGIDPNRTQRGKIGKVFKNKNNTSFELGHDKLFNGPGAIIADRSKFNFDNIIHTNRQFSNIEYNGPPINTSSLASTQRTIVE